MAKKKAEALGGLAVIADCHIANHARFGGPVVNGINARGAIALKAFEHALIMAAERGCRDLVVAGDLFHSRRPEPAIIAGVQQAIHRASPGIRVTVIPGNHDMLDADAAGGNTACAPLWQNASLVSEPGWREPGDCEALLVPFQSRVPMAMHLSEVLAVKPTGLLGRPRVLVTHVGVYDDADAPPWQRRAKDAIGARFLLDLLEAAGIDTAFVGNYHEHRIWRGERSRVVQLGTLCPASFSDAGLTDRGLMATYRDGGFSFVEVPGPRFVSIGCKEDENDFIRDGESKRIFVRGLGAYEVAHPEEFGGVEPATGGDTSSFSPLAEGGKTGSIEPLAALAEFVEGQQLPDGIDRGAVLDLVRECWTKGA